MGYHVAGIYHVGVPGAEKITAKISFCGWRGLEITAKIQKLEQPFFQIHPTNRSSHFKMRKNNSELEFEYTKRSTTTQPASSSMTCCKFPLAPKFAPPVGSRDGQAYEAPGTNVHEVHSPGTQTKRHGLEWWSTVVEGSLESLLISFHCISRACYLFYQSMVGASSWVAYFHINHQP